jgi:hypothetical protein
MKDKTPYHRRVRTGAGFLTVEQCRELVAWALDQFVPDTEQREIALQTRSICGRQLGLKMHTSNVMNLVRFWLVKNTDTPTVVIAEASAVHHSTVTRNVQRFEEYISADNSFQKILSEIDSISGEFDRKHFVPKTEHRPVGSQAN